MKAPYILIAALCLGTAVQAAQAPKPAPEASTAPLKAEADGEPLPSDAPKQPYELAAWCYGAMDQYLYIYTQIIPQLRDIDRMFGSSVKDEKEPYAADMAAAHVELKVLRGAVEAAEQASLKVIAPEGVKAVEQGRGIWGPAELHTRRELARAWLSWALPDRCASNATELTATSNLLGQALKYNGPSAASSAPTPLDLPAEEPATPQAPAAASAEAPTTTAPHTPHA